MNIVTARSSLWCFALLGAFVFSIPSAYADDAIMLDPALKGYVKVSGVSGNVNSIGSDTLNNLMTLWAEGFRKQYPNVKIQIEGKGSSTAPPALIEGTAQLGPMSRTMKNTEIDAFERKFRYKPTAFPVAIDALAVYVNKDNPVKGLTMAQVDAIFSKSRRWGHNENIQVGNRPARLTATWATVPSVSMDGTRPQARMDFSRSMR